MGESFVRRFSRLLSRSNYRDSKYLWQDREIRFDLPSLLLNPRNGEHILASLENVEDIKGTKFELGILIITNLRALWISSTRKRLNISIGLQCITETQFDEQLTRLKGGLYTIQITTRYSGSNFQFLFSCLSNDVQNVFDLLQHTHSEYHQMRVYRDLAIRDLLMTGSDLLLLKGEDIVDKVHPTYNLSCEQSNDGLMFITNLRIVWNSTNTTDFNISIPYIQVRDVNKRESQYGPALVVEIVPMSGGYVMGFTLATPMELDRITTEIKAMKSAYDKCPILTRNHEQNATQTTQLDWKQSEIELDKTDEGNPSEERRDVFARYCITGQMTGDATPVFDPHLGLAIEPLHNGITIQELWNVV